MVRDTCTWFVKVYLDQETAKESFRYSSQAAMCTCYYQFNPLECSGISVKDGIGLVEILL